MPRKSKRKRLQAREPMLEGKSRDRSRRRDEAKASFWKARIKSAIKAKDEFRIMGEEVDDYFKSKHGKLFDSANVRDHFMQFDGAAAVSVPKSAQVRNNLGPHLYPKNPKRNVNPKGQDGVLHGLARVLSVYINKTPREGKIAREARKVIDDALLRGRGFMRTGYDPTHGIVTSWYISSRDILIDPDVSSWQDAEWIAIRSLTPIWRVKREIKDKWRKRNLRPNYGTVFGDGSPEAPNQKAPFTNELLECWEIYSKMGSGELGAEFPDHFEERGSDFVKLTIASNHHVPISEGEWESPLYLDNEWPIEPLDFIETLDELWPESVMSQVMPLQKAMDLLTSLELNSCKQRGRFIIFGDQNLEERKQKLIRSGPPTVYIPIKRKSGERMADMYHVVQPGNIPTDIAQARAFLAQEFERTTGLTQVVHGGADLGAKDRSATASRQRADASSARLGDMRARVEENQTNVARHEAMVTRLQLTPKEVRNYVNPTDIGMFRVSITPSDELQDILGIEEIPLRSGAISMQNLSPQSATYFADNQSAAEAMMKALQDIADAAQLDMNAFLLAQDLDNSGHGLDVQQLIQQDPQTGETKLNLPQGVEVRPVTVEDVWEDTAGISPEELVRELGYEIAAGSMQKFDKSRELELAEVALSQVMPAAIQNGDYALANAIFQRVDDANEVPEDKRLPPLQPPPPPPEAAGGGGPPA